MEVTEAERDRIIEDRIEAARKGEIEAARKGEIEAARKGEIEAARKGEIEDCAAIIRNALQRIAELKGEVYVLIHKYTPFVDITASNIRVTAK